jgi:hypothetical protein
MTDLFFLEPADAVAWAPFAGVRPVAELRAGAWLIRERWEAALGLRATAILSDALLGFVDVDSPSVRSLAEITGPAVIARSDVVPPRVALAFATRRLTCGAETIAWKLGSGERWNGPDEWARPRRSKLVLPVWG